VGASQASDVATVDKLDNLARIANAIQLVAAGGTPTPALSVADMAQAGLSGVTADNLPAVLAAIAAKNDNGSETTSLGDLQTIVTEANTAYTAAIDAIEAYAVNNSAAAPTDAQYAAAGVKGVTSANVAAINSAIHAQAGTNGTPGATGAADADDATAVDSAADVQAIVNAYQDVLAAADGNYTNNGASSAEPGRLHRPGRDRHHSRERSAHVGGDRRKSVPM
jgi:hypothetical protein